MYIGHFKHKNDENQENGKEEVREYKVKGVYSAIRIKCEINIKMMGHGH